MICELCTWDITKGTMYYFSSKDTGNIHICAQCRDLMLKAESVSIDEPMCACGKMQKWVCDAAIKAPCRP